MLSQPIAVAFDLYHDGVVQQSVQQCSGHDRVAEDLAPLCEATVGGEDHGVFLVACIDQLKEQTGTVFGDWQVTDLFDDQQGAAGIGADFLL